MGKRAGNWAGWNSTRDRQTIAHRAGARIKGMLERQVYWAIPVALTRQFAITASRPGPATLLARLRYRWPRSESLTQEPNGFEEVKT